MCESMCGSPEHTKQGRSEAAPHVGQGTETTNSGVRSFSFIAERYGCPGRKNCSILNTFGSGYFGRSTSCPWTMRFPSLRAAPCCNYLRLTMRSQVIPTHLHKQIILAPVILAACYFTNADS